MEVYALNSSFDVVTVCIPYTNLQWSRKYYEAGDYSMQVPAYAYDPAWAYIGTADRPELGIVQKIEYDSEGGATVQVSGFFAEKMLDDRCCFPRYVGNASTTEGACIAIFDRYAKGLGIAKGAANSPMLGDRTRSDFADDELGRKLYSILKTREMSQRVAYDYVSSKLVWSVWQGLDRTQSQEANPWYAFTSEFGNVSRENANIDASAVKNYCIIPAKEDDNGKETVTVTVDWTNGSAKKEIVLDKRSSKPEEGQSLEDFKAALYQEGVEKLTELTVIEDVEIENADASDYLSDYDLGDKCSVIISDIGKQMDARIVEIDEVFKASGHSVSLVFGNKRIYNVRKAVF